MSYFSNNPEISAEKLKELAGVLLALLDRYKKQVSEEEYHRLEVAVKSEREVVFDPEKLLKKASAIIEIADMIHSLDVSAAKASNIEWILIDTDIPLAERVETLLCYSTEFESNS